MKGLKYKDITKKFMGVLCILLSYQAFSQQPDVESFKQLLSSKLADSLKIELLNPNLTSEDRIRIMHSLSYNMLFSKPDSAMIIAQQGLELAKKINYTEGEILCETQIGGVFWILGDYTKAKEIFLKCLKNSYDVKNSLSIEWSLAWLTSAYRDEGNYKEALKFGLKGLSISKNWSPKVWNLIVGSVYQGWGKSDSALLYLIKGDVESGFAHVTLGHVYMELGNKLKSKKHYLNSIPILVADNNYKDMADAYKGLAELYKQERVRDTSIYYAGIGLEIAQNASFKKWVMEISLLLSDLYEEDDAWKSLSYYKLAMAAKDSIYNLTNITQSIHSRYNEQLEQLSYQNKIRIYILTSFLGFLVILAFILWRNNRNKQKAKANIERAYSKLKSTQSQLIQSEKMASLGELTAGIAHEIQNPLNFVNNFSEISNELIDEMKEELDKGDIDEAKAISNDIKQNLEKINHHGKRADAIVKGMLQHSRSSSGVKEPTDINALADEYLRLAYHGLRAKDKSFNAEFKTDFEPNLPKVNVIPQDIGRVLLNLINNAFYAVQPPPPSRNESGTGSEGGIKNSQTDYKPTVIVSTTSSKSPLGDSRLNDAVGQVGVKISVKDNGNGIPPHIIDKIFQPFFTTKPTGQGTGLGLSLAYDIVKAHGGELKVETKEGEGTEFIINIPLNE